MTTPTPFLQGALCVIYDDPPDVCDGCGFVWASSVSDALSIIEAAPGRYAAALDGQDGMTPQSDGSWNATAYVWHLVDLARSWTERWVQLREDPGTTLVGWDPDVLADARGYRSLPTTPGLWAMRDAVTAFISATASIDLTVTYEHADWGTGDVADGLRWLANEYLHHQADVSERSTPQ